MFLKARKKIRWLVGLSLLLPSAVKAQQTRALQLTEAIQLARVHNNGLRADSLQYLIQGKHISQAKVGRLPEITINATLQRISNNIDPFIITLPAGSFAINPQILNQSYNAVQLRQLLFSGGKVKNSIKSSVQEAEASKSDFLRSRLQLDQQSIDLWFNLYNARVSEKIILTNIEALSKTREDLDKLRIQGIVLENDLLKIELSITRLRSSLADISALSGSLNYNLCLATGLDPATRIDIPEEYIEGSNALQPLKTYTDVSLNRRPEIASLKYRRVAAEYRIQSVKADYFPTMSLIGSYNYDRPNQRIIPNLARFDYSALIGLNLSWRISSFYTNQHKLAESRLAASQLDYTTEQVKENIQAEVNSQYLEYRKTIDKIALTEIELKQATENYRVEQHKLAAQTTTPTDFLSANAALLQAQLNLATAKANAELAYHKLINTTGETAN
jgi:outer membrane protein